MPFEQPYVQGFIPQYPNEMFPNEMFSNEMFPNENLENSYENDNNYKIENVKV
jgi:hypothetical protein